MLLKLKVYFSTLAYRIISKSKNESLEDKQKNNAQHQHLAACTTPYNWLLVETRIKKLQTDVLYTPFFIRTSKIGP